MREVVTIVSWLGGEHWYIGEKEFLHLEDAIAFCEKHGLDYVIETAPRHVYTREGD